MKHVDRTLVVVQVVLLVYRCDVLQVSNPHEGFVEVVKLQNAGQQEEARDQNTAEELGQSKRLQTNRCQPEGNRGHGYTSLFHF